MKHITDGKGRWIGHVDERKDVTTYTNGSGRTVARVKDGKTFDVKGRFEGNGDQGMRFLKKSS
jgi:hypothetical protein